MVDKSVTATNVRYGNDAARRGRGLIISTVYLLRVIAFLDIFAGVVIFRFNYTISYNLLIEYFFI